MGKAVGATRSGVPGDLHAKLMGFNELSGRWAFAFYLVLFIARKRASCGWVPDDGSFCGVAGRGE